MKAEQEQPLTEVVKLAEQHARILWRCYTMHRSVERRDPAWTDTKWELLEKCLAAEARACNLRERANARQGSGGPACPQ